MTRRAAAMQVVRFSTLLVPSLEERTRYRLELAAELFDLPPGRCLPHAVGFALRVTALRHALIGHDAQAPRHCRWHLYHRYRTATADDGHRYRRCADCGKDQPGIEQPRDDVAWAGFISR